MEGPMNTSPANPHTILIATGNPHKLEEISRIFEPLGLHAVGLDTLDDKPPEPVEDAEDFMGNARIKAVGYARATGRRCLADDSGLVVDALDGEPGVHSAYWAGAEGTRDERDARNNDKLLRELHGIPEENRTARFVCVMCYADPKGTILATSQGEMPGWIAHEKSGEHGFGYDPLLVVADARTSAELTPEEKNAMSHRGKAAREIAPKILEILSSPAK